MKRVVLQQNESSFFSTRISYSSTEIPFLSQVITANHQIKQVKNNEFILRSTHKAKKNVLVLLLKPFFNNILFLCENLSNLRREERKKNVSHNFFSNEKQKNIKKENYHSVFSRIH